MCGALFILFDSFKGILSNGGKYCKCLVEMGFENVGWTEDDNERVYVLQNSAYRLQGVGISKAVDVIQKIGLTGTKKMSDNRFR